VIYNDELHRIVMIFKKGLYITAVYFFILFFATADLLAGVSVSPDRHRILLLPGEEETVMYHIHNSGDEDVDIVIEPKAWAGVKDPYQWLDMEDDVLYVKAGESTPLSVNTRVPEGAEGEMVAMLFLCYKDSVGSQLNIRQGVPLYMVVSGTERYGLEIQDISLSYGKRGHFYNLGFVVKMQNISNAHIVPDVSVIVKNDKGRVLNKMALKRPNIVLRDKSQTYRLGWREPGLRDGIYTATVILDYEDKIEPKAKEISFQISGDRVEKIEQVNTGD
jgi:hypothetical protein